MFSDNGVFSCFMKKNYIVLSGLVVLACLFLFVFNIGTVFAQEGDTTATTIQEVSEEEAVEDEEEVITEEELPADVLLDEKVTTEDLGATEAGVLPGSVFHVFKRFGWTVQEILETDPVADAELKIQHANQELSELKQLIDEKGFSEISPNTINGVLGRFEGRLENVNNVAEALKELKSSNPEAVDELLNNLTDKQFKYQKVLESIEQDVIEAKEENPDAGKRIEDVFIKVTETKDKALEHYGDVIGTVDEDNPEKIAERIIKIADKQEGSEFKHLKNLEVLKRLEGQVPESAKGAIALAQENTLKFFNRDISALPEEARAQRFEQYNRFSYGDETRQLSFLDDLKLLDDIPPEILKKIEEIKEFAITKFEEKMSHFESPDVLDSYMGHLSGENFNDMVLAEQFASRVMFEDNPEIRQRMDDIRDKSIEEFTARFTDSESQAQIAKFQELERILEERPGDPKVMKMMQELEAQVRSDPTKAEFLNQIDQLEDKMRFEFEAKFRDEGDRYFDRIGTLDPRDFEIYQGFSGENFLPEDLADKFLDHGVDQYRDYMRDIDDPNQFDRFNTRFNDVPQFVIDEIGYRDDGFGDAMQFKRQAMEKLRFEQERQMEIDRQQVDFQERELFHQLDRARRQADEDFWRRIDSIPYENFDERQALFEEKRQTDLARLDEEHEARTGIFNTRLELDPWCDSACQQIQKQFIDQEFRHQKERIQDDYISQQKQIEFDLGREMQNNPLFGLCNTPESCDAYCENNPNIPACQGFFPEPIFYDDFGPKDYDCGPGKYFDFKFDKCVEDPYYRAPTDFKQCPFGSHWDGQRGFCEPDFIPEPIFYPDPINKPDCGSDSYFDFRENRCISYHIDPTCPQDSFLTSFGECKQENFQCPDLSVMDLSCPTGEIRDEFIDNNGCKAFSGCRPVGQKFQCPDIAAAYYAPCPAGQNRDIITDYNGCQVFSECRGDGLPVPIACPMFDYLPCPNEGEYREEYRNSDGCLVPGKCVPGAFSCDAYFEGYEYDTATDRCEFRNSSGCSDPYKYHSLEECQNGNITGTTPSSWTNHTWYFNDGSSVFSSVLSRTDAEYLNYVAGIDAQCKNISQNQFAWKTGAGDDSSSNWQNFGIPDCSGNAQPNTYPTPTYPSSDSECASIEDLIPGCHLMSESPDVRFNTAMDQYVQVGTRTIQYCSANSIPGCTSYYSSTSGYCGDNVCNSNETSSSCYSDCRDSSVMERCFYPNATVNGASTGYTVWCEFDYVNCHQGDPSGATLGLSGLSLGAPSSCESGYTGGGSDTTTSAGYCGDGQCSSSEDTYNCSADCGGSTSTYAGDENSCPGFAYSMWDQGGVRYCQLNNSTSCDYNYPSYLTDDGSYTAANCPTNSSQPSYGGCEVNTNSGSCTSESNCKWYSDSSTSYCYYDSGGSTYVGDSGCDDILDILPGCHLMSESPDVRFNTAMDQYVQVGTRTIQYCSANSIPGCTSYYSSGSTYCSPPSYWDSASGGCVSSDTTSSCEGAGGFECSSGYEYDSNGCVSGCLPEYVEPSCPNSPSNLTCDNGYEYDGTGCVTGCIPPPAPTCMTASDYGHCDYGHEYDGGGCVIGCMQAPPEPPPEEDPPPAASVWEALKALFGF